MRVAIHCKQCGSVTSLYVGGMGGIFILPRHIIVEEIVNNMDPWIDGNEHFNMYKEFKYNLRCNSNLRCDLQVTT